MNLRIVGLLAAVTVLSGCASIVNGTQQSISVVAKTPESVEVVGARCALSNTKGDWFITTPASVTVHRGYGVMTIKCDHPDWLGELEAKSTTKAMAFGNILFGGAIGLTVDIANGSAYDYPQLIAVPMQSKRSVKQEGTPASPAVAPVVVTPIAIPAEKPVAATPMGTAEAPAPAGMKGGQDGFSAEKLAKNRSCSTQPAATLVAKGPGFESYSVACSSGDALAIRCEFGNCRVLQ